MPKIQRVRKSITGIVTKQFSEEDMQYWFAIKELTSREIKRKYARSYLGIIWSVLNPLLNMIVMSLIFSYMFKRSIQYFPLYYLTGQIIWTLFSTATNTSLSALVDNKTFLLKTKLPRQTFILSRVYTALTNTGYSLIPYVLLLIFFRVKPSWKMLFFIPDIFFILVFSLGVGYILSIVYVFFADVKHLYGIFLTILMYMSALFYPVTSLPEFMKNILKFNPVYQSIYIARESLVYNRMPDFEAWIVLFVWSLVTFLIGYYIFKKNGNKILAIL